jgi:hypothetical protein
MTAAVNCAAMRTEASNSAAKDAVPSFQTLQKHSPMRPGTDLKHMAKASGKDARQDLVASIEPGSARATCQATFIRGNALTKERSTAECG